MVKDSSSQLKEQYAALITGLGRQYGLDEAQQLLDSGEIKQHAGGNVVLPEGSAAKATSVLLLLTGKLEIFITEGSEDRVVGKIDPPYFLGASAVLGIPRNASARTSEPSVVLEWDLTAFRHLLLQNPSLSKSLLGRALSHSSEEESAPETKSKSPRSWFAFLGNLRRKRKTEG